MKLRTIGYLILKGHWHTEKVFSLTGGIIVAVLAILITVDIFLRFIFHDSVRGLYELAEFILVGSIYMSIAHVQAEKGHVRIEIFTSKLSRKIQRVLTIFGYLIGIVVFSVITWRAGCLAWQAWNTHEYSSGVVQWPMWPVKVVVPIGTGLLCLRLIYDTWEVFNQP